MIALRGLALSLIAGAVVLVAQACASSDESTFGNTGAAGAAPVIDSGTDVSSNGGSGGSGGSAGTGGSSGTGGGATCQDAFCPSTGAGQPCCVTPYGPCGTDIGQGCQENQIGDF